MYICIYIYIERERDIITIVIIHMEGLGSIFHWIAGARQRWS